MSKQACRARELGLRRVVRGRRYRDRLRTSGSRRSVKTAIVPEQTEWRPELDFRLANFRAVWEPCRANVKLRRTTKIAGLLWGTCVLIGCAGRGPYRVTESYTALSAKAPNCRHSQPTVIVPVLPAHDRLLGDVIVSCERSCPREYAIDTLLSLAKQHGATRVSALSCVQRAEGWLCVGHASATPLCEEES